MKKIKLLFQMMIVCFVFLMCMFKNTSKAYAGLEQVECVVSEIEICNICGHRYDGGQCTHVKGVTYNYNVCSPEEIKYCNICGEDIRYCEHVEGWEYGGEICDTYEWCNICGKDMFDKNSGCTHVKGRYYNQMECSPYTIYVCSICNENYWGGECPHNEGSWYDEGYCELDQVEICNICGYMMGSDRCSHDVGEFYGGTECRTIVRCKICNNDYYDANGACPHEAGHRYGWTVCETNIIKICNLCGKDYNDPSACGHWEGQHYGGQECSVTQMKICSVCKDEYDKCLHIRGKEYKNIAYYFYIEDRRKQAESDVADLITIKEDESNPYNYKNKIYEIVKFETNNEEKFREAWENVGKFNESACCVYAVMMNMHGTPTEISNGPGKGYSLRMNIDDINSLERKPVQRLILLQCSVGNVDYAGENIASVFAKKISGQVLAGDAEVHNVKEEEKVNIKGEPDSFTSLGRYEKYYCDGRGWYTYKYDWDKKDIEYEQIALGGDKHEFRIYQLIDLLTF